ncbi:class I SAM-dependent methyltransferase [Desulfobaculum sp. SPO524]|uniref:class I SAM-dependent methyltransferase n=1 Tax=Desulfobaculum sp. SPO524 TaxID=3378071 RepID=UPI003851A013
MGKLISLLDKIPVSIDVLLDVMLWLHNTSYAMASRLAVRSEGMHPKLRIQQYYLWFCSHLNGSVDVLDIGCGKGFLAKQMASVARSVTAVDIVESNVQEAMKLHSRDNITYIHADATDKSIFNRRYDVVVLSNVLEHIESRVSFLLSVKELMCPDGYILLRVPMFDRDWITPFKKERGLEWRLDPTHYTEYTMADLQKEMRTAGLEMSAVSVTFGECYGVVRAK